MTAELRPIVRALRQPAGHAHSFGLPWTPADVILSQMALPDWIRSSWDFADLEAHAAFMEKLRSYITNPTAHDGSARTV